MKYSNENNCIEAHLMKTFVLQIQIAKFCGKTLANNEADTEL